MEFAEHDKRHIRFPLKKEKAEGGKPKSFIPDLDDLIENAEVLIRGKEYDLAKNLVGRSLQFYPDNLPLLHLLAEVSVVLEDWPMVETSYSAIVNIDPSEENVIKYCV